MILVEYKTRNKFCRKECIANIKVVKNLEKWTCSSTRHIFLSLLYEGKMKISRPSLRKTRDKGPLGRDPDRSWYHHHTTSMIKLFWSQSMAPWTSAAAYGQGDKFSVWPTTDMKLGKSGRCVGTRTGAGVTATLAQRFFGRSPWIHGLSSSTLICCRQCPWSHGWQPQKHYTCVEVTSAPFQVLNQWLLVPSSTTVVG